MTHRYALQEPWADHIVPNQVVERAHLIMSQSPWKHPTKTVCENTRGSDLLNTDGMKEWTKVTCSTFQTYSDNNRKSDFKRLSRER